MCQLFEGERMQIPTTTVRQRNSGKYAECGPCQEKTHPGTLRHNVAEFFYLPASRNFASGPAQFLNDGRAVFWGFSDAILYRKVILESFPRVYKAQQCTFRAARRWSAPKITRRRISGRVKPKGLHAWRGVQEQSRPSTPDSTDSRAR